MTMTNEERLNEKIEQLQSELDGLKEVVGPAGEWVCPECGFMLYTRAIDTASGKIGIALLSVAPECENACGTMRRRSWKESEECWAKGQEALLCRAERVERKLATSGTRYREKLASASQMETALRSRIEEAEKRVRDLEGEVQYLRKNWKPPDNF